LRKQQSEMMVQSVCPLCGHENAPPSLPGDGADAGQGSPSASAPQGITYLHDAHTKVTLPSWDWDPGKVVLRDMNDFPQQLDRMVEAARPKRKKK